MPASTSSYSHGQPSPIGVLLCNLGTPDAPTPAATRRYLAEFLGDPRVVEIPKVVWWPILHGVILRTRPAKSAKKYASIWTPEGSPLAVWTDRQAKLLQGYLGERGCPVIVKPAMRYGNPSIASALDAFQAAGVRRVLVLPAYPQYSGATTASTFDAVSNWGQRTRWVPEFRFIHQYHDDAAHIAALAASVRVHWQREGRGEMLLMSFHGMPERTLKLGDPYHCQSQKTARLLAEELRLAPTEWRIGFQSRFGRAKWLGPATDATLKQLAAGGTQRVDVICPGFAADCLETLEEIAQEGRETFLHAGGRAFHYIPCLNDSPAGMAALADLARRHLAGWFDGPPAGPDVREASRQRALALGASD
ncbi:MAG TPA: ferrochelatase [Ideonella sp.]|uniref:ferrochelatase n=1 Tax=Ideonella sp. TaxID=1929293 RepID=UPI002E3781CD|nr:ferrochelatase [Ideonella sp.]HEX5683680.1 ferrochelatase [Ideonella sp.]